MQLLGFLLRCEGDRRRYDNGRARDGGDRLAQGTNVSGPPKRRPSIVDTPRLMPSRIAHTQASEPKSVSAVVRAHLTDRGILTHWMAH